MSSPPQPHPSASTTALAVGLGFGVAAVAGVAVGVLFSANALTIAAASRQRAKPPLEEADVVEDDEGRILNWRYALRIIQQRGISPSLRERLWPILLGVYPPGSTAGERDTELQRLHAVYTKLLGICSQLEAELSAARESSEAEGDDLGPRRAPKGAAATAFAEAHRIIVLDALRSDMRACERVFDPGANLECVPLPASEEEELLSDLMLIRHEDNTTTTGGDSDSGDSGSRSRDYGDAWCSEQARDALGMLSPRHSLHVPRTLRLVRVLSAYSVHDPETGYCQGMADLASVVVQLVEDEALAFACFERIMRSTRANFRHDERGIRRKLGELARIVSDTEQELYARLVALGAGDCMFAYRMVVVMLRRELPLEQVLLVWEAAWAYAAALPGAADGVPLAPAGGARRMGHTNNSEKALERTRSGILTGENAAREEEEESSIAQEEVTADEEQRNLDAEKSASNLSGGEGTDNVLGDNAEPSSMVPTTAPEVWELEEQPDAQISEPSAEIHPSETVSQKKAAASSIAPPALGTPDFVLQFIAAVIRGQKREILTQCHGTDDVLRLFSRVRIDFWVTLVQAQKQYKAYSTGPSSLRSVG